MKKSLIIFTVIIAVIIVLLISIYNGIVTKQEIVETQYSNLDVMLQRRADLIPNLVNTVEGYTEHEKEIIDKLAQSRQNLLKANTIQEKEEANNELERSIDTLMVIVESYPDLKASENFINLQDELAGTENRIAVSRRDYNNAVQTYNTSIKRFPNNLLANIFGFEEEKYFETDEKNQEVPNVSFK